jgi:hypothetical protein
MKRNEWKSARIVRRLSLAALLAFGTLQAGSAAAQQPADRAAVQAPTDQAAAPATDQAAASSAAVAVGKAVPRLQGTAPDRQLQAIRWMLAAGDDRRLVFLFPDLGEARQEPLDRRAALARQRLEELAADLEKAGHQAPPAATEVARIDPDAPPPNYFPPSLIQGLERVKDDPEAARILEEVRKTSPRGTRPPGR